MNYNIRTLDSQVNVFMYARNLILLKEEENVLTLANDNYCSVETLYEINATFKHEAPMYTSRLVRNYLLAGQIL